MCRPSHPVRARHRPGTPRRSLLINHTRTVSVYLHVKMQCVYVCEKGKCFRPRRNGFLPEPRVCAAGTYRVTNRSARGRGDRIEICRADVRDTRWRRTSNGSGNFRFATGDFRFTRKSIFFSDLFAIYGVRKRNFTVREFTQRNELMRYGRWPRSEHVCRFACNRTYVKTYKKKYKKCIILCS